jgi:hypothetical protein
MTKQPMQATSEKGAGKPDGVNDTPAKDAGGESGGGAYPNPQTGKTPKSGGFMGHGGQTDIAYSGPDGADENAATKE